MINSLELRKKYLEFFGQKGHARIPSAPLVPENDPTVLFITAGMHPLVPYLLGQPHPAGKRLVSVQKCLRTDDIEEVGDATHNTFFEMLGNWSLGDYWKKEALEWSWEFLTSKEWLGLDGARIYVTIFAGDQDAPRDTESLGIWRSLGVPPERIFEYGKDKNWWGPAGETGPCGPDSEMFFETGREHDVKFGEKCHPNCDCGRFVEVWNDVFMQYNKKADGTFEPLKQKNVDTGMGLERMTMILEDKESIYQTDLFISLMEEIKSLSTRYHERSARVIADHLRAAVFLIADGVVPSNVERGYVLRRLIRRAIRYGRTLEIKGRFIGDLALTVVKDYQSLYPQLKAAAEKISRQLTGEEEKFNQTLEGGLKEFEKLAREEGRKKISGGEAFRLYETYGFPFEITQELAKERGLEVDEMGFRESLRKHQELSRAGAVERFRGGLADQSEETTKLHTATHLLQAALREVLGPHVYQKGSNITSERLRFDFSHPQKLTEEELKKVEDLVNQKISQDLVVRREEMTRAEAERLGAIGLFDEKYAAKVSVYLIGPKGAEFSKELCGGPHVDQVGKLGRFKIVKEEAVSAGVRRIKAILE
jgi:alanyl-tRNA synthetase